MADTAKEDVARRKLPVTIIRATTGWKKFRFDEVWEFRELLGMMIWRQIAVRYKQTVVGVLWAVVRPVMMAVIFTFIFSRLARISSGDVPYPVFVLSGLILWQFFAAAVTAGCASMLTNAGMLGKVYFPRLLLPISAVSSGVVDFLISIVVLFAVMAYYGYIPGLSAVFALLFILLAAFIALGVSLCLSALNAIYRDIGIALPFAVQIWMFASPVIYPYGLVPKTWAWLLIFNPMGSVIQGFRWALLGTPMPSVASIAYAVGFAVILFATGTVVFRRLERTLVDQM